MGGKKAGENSKKAAGQARKAEAAASKTAAENARKDAAEDSKWNKGSKDDSKKEAEAAKKAEQARKKAELKALEAEEAKSLPDKAPKKNKAAEKKTNNVSRGLDLSQLEGESALNASGIDNALDALSITGGSNDKIDRHPERRFKAAYTAFEERRLAEMDADGSGAGLRLNQRKDKLRKEFEKSPDNPFNQVSAAYNASKSDVADLKNKERTKIEGRLQ